MDSHGGRCGPLCQHPGCWYSGEKNRIAYQKSRRYLSYLAELLAKRSLPHGFQHESSTPGGLPTLKVQTINDDSVLSEHSSIRNQQQRQHRRAKTLPALKPNGRSHADPSPPQTTARRVNFVQMTLEEEATDDCDDCGEIVFSPVLIWRSRAGRRQQRQQKPAPQEPSRSEGGGRRCVPMKRTDLTEALPPERSASAVERKAKSSKGRRRLATADVESFSYLRDIPPHIVAQILEQLRSASSSNVDEVCNRPVTGTSLHHSHQRQQHINASHIPPSIVHGLSSKTLQRTSETRYLTPPHSGKSRKKMSSFSRELSKRPREVLRKQSVKPGVEKVDENSKQRSLAEWKKPTKQVDHSSHCTMPKLLLPPSMDAQEHTGAGKHVSLPSVRYPYGNPIGPRIQQRVSFTGDVSRKEGSTLEGMVRDSIHPPSQSDGPLQISPYVSSRVVTFQAGVVPIEDAAQLEKDASQDRPQPQSPRLLHIIRVPRLLPSSSHSYTQRPFSEEISTVTPELKVVPPSAKSVTPQHGGVLPEEDEDLHVSSEHRPLSVSPDYMLVGARFSGDQLVLLDSEGKIIHQLTDTESDANIAYSETRIASGSEMPLLYANKLPTGTQAPPPTASDYQRIRDNIPQESEQNQDGFNGQEMAVDGSLETSTNAISSSNVEQTNTDVPTNGSDSNNTRDPTLCIILPEPVVRSTDDLSTPYLETEVTKDTESRLDDHNHGSGSSSHSGEDPLDTERETQENSSTLTKGNLNAPQNEMADRDTSL